MNLRRHTCLAIGAFGAAAVSMAAYAVTAVVEKPAVIASATGGQQLFNAQCIACHGVDARGVEGLGVSLVDSGFVALSSQQELIEFLKVGRMSTDPATVTGLVMPGFAWMADADLAALAQRLQSIAE